VEMELKKRDFFRDIFGGLFEVKLGARLKWM